MWNHLSYISLALPLFIAFPVWYWSKKRSKNTLSYPPGPKAYPLIGNLLDFPLSVPFWEGLASLSKQYETDVLRLKLPGMEMVVLNTSETISELLDQRSAIYSDKVREFRSHISDARFSERAMTFMPYGPRWRMHRKLFNDFISASTAKDHDVNQAKVVSDLLINLHREPETFREHINLLTGSLALSIAYGIRADTPHNEFILMYEKMLKTAQEGLVPGTFLVDMFPFLRHLPSWFPGVQFHAFANKVKTDLHIAITRPVEHVAEKLKSGVDIDPSMASTCLENLDDLGQKGIDIEVIRNTLGIVYAGRLCFTNSTLSSFFLAMARSTEIMRTAQCQLDSVLGGARLPDHSDIDDLPYIVAIVKETLRWAPPAPIGTTHRLMEDDVYRGMFIPGGATVIENIWAVCYDETAYPEPHKYNPARFLDENGRIDSSVKDPEARVFGSGRRICPGRHLALRMLYLTIARILATFDIFPADKDGRPSVPEARYNKSLLREPMPFECVVNPRSEQAVKLIYDAVAIHQ
ncbi:cytochrome P450 [Thelephora terrestris]|uniref:Cytochrome P450 n=1 Tax=Thelephora terrestris TaxID=56493 RepID=A0A9P6L502_9AGAM|nr:cytochrome P450 [Thelephora terrestris]